ncbi:hypothetical protein I6G82_15270 [Lysinibacillus macroides]|uniref:hypothetical protein n=1 Tax=Lysinibacillus macroides TaxID=33935 RepID=UPI00193563D9|nr:hypothetical protein I6G82_15270 [Lysinibacillus macroides]
MDKKEMGKALHEIYAALYPLVQTSEGKKMFNTKIVKNFKYTPDEVAEMFLVSENTENKKEKKESIREEILNITQLDELRKYYYESLSGLFSTEENDSSATKINTITIAELKHLYAIISTVPIQSRKTKKDIVYMIKNYFDNEARTKDMMKNL